MRFKLLILLIILLSVNTSAQLDVVQPVFTIDCPKSFAESGTIVRLSASTDAEIGEESSYEWSVSAGAIAQGQGTRTVEVETLDSKSITVTVEINDDAFDTVTASCTFEVRRKPSARLAFEFNYSTPGYVKMILDSYFADLQNDPAAKGYISIFPKSDRDHLQLLKLITNQMTLRRYDHSRVTIVRGENSSRSYLQFWILPAGADAPLPEN